jgi:hypothetical protein
MKQVASKALLAACFMPVSFFGLLINLEDRGDTFLQNTDWLSVGYTVLYLKR